MGLLVVVVVLVVLAGFSVVSHLCGGDNGDDGKCERSHLTRNVVMVFIII